MKTNKVMDSVINEQVPLVWHHPTEAIFTFLANEIHDTGHWETINGTLKLTLPRPCLEKRLGTVLQQIQYVVDKQYPQRKADIPLMIIDDEGKYCFNFKIWHTA